MKTFLILVLIVAVVGLPFLFQGKETTIGRADDTVVVITPHNEAIRFEFETAFRRWYEERTGRTVNVDWRVIGGTSDIVRYLNSEFENSFRNLWTGPLGESWTPAVRSAYNNRRLTVDGEPQDEGEKARQAFLDSDVSVGIDIFFGGGAYDFGRQAQMGALVPWMETEQLEERFPDSILPQEFAGEEFWDEQGRWIGAVLSSFGIIYNKDSLNRLGIKKPPAQWGDLTIPLLIGQVALADPTKSGSITKAFEMIVQDQMHRSVDALEAEGLSADEAEAVAVPEGWMNAMQMIQLISANARYFTDSATKGPMDVAKGDCAVGMSIDFYGRYESEIIETRGGGDRLQYITPEGASTLSADPIGILRGAPNREVADRFVDFVMSEDGQQLWGFRAGVEGGPVEYSLRRSPAFRTIYEGANRELLSEPDVNPYKTVLDFVYRPDWTGRLFSPLRFLIRVAFIDPHDELVSAWKGIQRARERGDVAAANEAFAVFSNLETIRFSEAAGPIAEVLSGGDKIAEVRLARDLADGFRAQYRQALAIANGSI
ncbi:MAG: extracellular solute-binding protein [Verrucomicrobiota bacterium]